MITRNGLYWVPETVLKTDADAKVEHQFLCRGQRHLYSITGDAWIYNGDNGIHGNADDDEEENMRLGHC